MYWKKLKRSEKRFLSEEKEINKAKKKVFLMLEEEDSLREKLSKNEN